MPGLLERGLAHHRKGEFREAARVYKKLLRTKPDAPDPLHLLGCTELARGRIAEGTRLIKKAIAIAPSVALYRENLAEAYHRDGNPQAAAQECRLALNLNPKSARALNLLGSLALEAGEPELARDRFSAALRANPRHVEAMINMAAALNRLGDFDLASTSAELALKLTPGNPLAWNNFGIAHRGAGDLETARDAFARAAEALPRARFNLGYLHLLEGELETGFALCEARPLPPIATVLNKRRWDGRPKPAKRLLVVHEQGLGDSILMGRFFADLADRFREVTVLVQAPMQRLLARVDPRVRVVDSLQGVGYDLWCPAFSLPNLLGIRTADDMRSGPWLERGPRPADARLRAGINWAGNPRFHYDRTRSTRLEVIEPLLAMDGVEWVSLHKGHREDEATEAGLPQPLRDVGDFQDTAEVLSGLDLIVSTETAIPNLSAAMGIPTAILAAVDHDWRWHYAYPEVTVCAQDTPGDWSSAVTRAAVWIGDRLRRAA